MFNSLLIAMGFKKSPVKDVEPPVEVVQEVIAPEDLPAINYQQDGRIVISEDRVGIEYKGLGCFIQVNDLPRVASALRLNWAEFERISSNAPPGCVIEKRGKMDMLINVAPYFAGVWIYHAKIGARNAEQLHELATSYERAYKTIKDFQKTL